MTVKIGEDVTYPLKQEDIDFYNENGYLVVNGLYSDEECDYVLKHIKRHADKDFAALMQPHREDFLTKFDPRPKTKIVNKEIKETSQFLYELMKDPRAVKILTNLIEKHLTGEIDRELMGVMSQVIFKEVNSAYASQAWEPHQDNAYTRNPNGLYITTNLFLADADLDNGTMYVYPGSHKFGLFDFEERTSFRETKGTNPGNVVKNMPPSIQKVDVMFKKGDVLVLHGNCVHGSYPNKSTTRSRPLYMNTYIPNGEFFIPGRNAGRRTFPLN